MDTRVASDNQEVYIQVGDETEIYSIHPNLSEKYISELSIYIVALSTIGPLFNGSTTSNSNEAGKSPSEFLYLLGSLWRRPYIVLKNMLRCCSSNGALGKVKDHQISNLD